MLKKRTVFALGVVAVTVMMSGTIAFAADQIATTREGKTVILSPDGTWKEASDNKGGATNKPASATVVKTGQRVSYRVWFDPKDWGMDPAPSNEAAEYELENTQGEAWALIIPERLNIGLEAASRIVIDNARDAATKVTVVSEKRVTVNGRQMVELRYDAVIQGMEISYLAVVYSGDEGTVQVLTMTTTNLFKEHEGQFRKLLAGLEIL
jgi:hypothetical protein